MVSKLNNELIEAKKQEILDFLQRNYPITDIKGVNNKFQTRYVIASKYEEYFKNHIRKPRFFNTTNPKWEDDPRIWINIHSTDENDRHCHGLLIQIKCNCEKWNSGNSMYKSKRKFAEKWGFPINNKNIKYTMSHGKILFLWIVNEEILTFNPTQDYFSHFLKESYKVYKGSLPSNKELSPTTDKKLMMEVEELKTESEHNVITNLKENTTVAAIRLLPMSETDPEFNEKSINEVQEWFINKLPHIKYNFKKGINADIGTLVLFQYKSHVIASAILERKILYSRENSGGYRGAYCFVPSSIAVFTPITSTEIKSIWNQFKGFNQSPQQLDVNQYKLLYHLLLEKNMRYVVDRDTDEETFQREVENTKVNVANIVKDSPIEKGSQIIAPLKKWKRNPITSKNAIVLAGYKCEYDNSHTLFKSATTGENYVEAHHLIPMEYQDRFDVSIDVEANIISLCVTCHKKLHHAVFEEKEAILKQLFNERKNRLEQCGIGILEDILLTYYK